MKKEKNLHKIESFMKRRSFVLYGASAKKKKFGNSVLQELGKKNYRLYVIHRYAKFIDGKTAYQSLNELPEIPEAAILVIPPDETEHVIDDIISAGIKNIWFQQGSVSEKAVRYAELNGINVIKDECILMFVRHAGFPHNLHKWVWSLGAVR
jgi:predicted CoA-binding protein